MHTKRIIRNHLSGITISAIFGTLLIIAVQNQTVFSPVPKNSVAHTGVQYLQHKQITSIVRQVRSDMGSSVHSSATDFSPSRSVYRWFSVTP